jgi:SAM-dependent methyltransferase
MPSAPRTLPINSERSQRQQPCDLCQGTNFEVVSGTDRKRKPLTTVICTRCGLVSHEKIPTDEEMEEFYATEYRHDYHGELTPSGHRVVRAWRNGQRLLHDLQDHAVPGDAFLEVGAGLGCTVKAFELAGYEAAGIEPGESFQAYSRQQLLADVEHLSLEDLEPVPTYDFMLLVHVIEHFNSPSRALSHMFELLQPEGRLYIECPNVAAPHAAPGKIFHYAHIHNFTPQTLIMMAESSGFELAHCMSNDSDVDLRMVFTKRDVRRLQPDPDSYRTTMEALTRYNTLTYHLRWNYLVNRARRFCKIYSDYFFASTRMRQIVNQCKAYGKPVESEMVEMPLRKSA